MHVRRHPLNEFARARAERFFGDDLSAVTIQVSRAPEWLGALAFACGDTIHVAPRALRLGPLRAAELLGHELTHVIQQRQGRVAPRPTTPGLPLVSDPNLEAEAVLLGHRFAHRPWHRPSWSHRDQPRKDRILPTIQPMVTVGGHPLAQASSLSPAALEALTFIVDGKDWLEWAIDDQDSQYAYTNEPRLLAAIQTGLHGTPTALLRKLGLLIGPLKLMTLGLDSLQTLVAVESGTEDTNLDRNARQIIDTNQLRTASMLAHGSAFLGTLGVAQAPVFQAMGLDECIALYELMQTAQSATGIGLDLQTEAAQAALELAQSPLEFIDYFTGYIVTAYNQNALDGTAQQRQGLFKAALETLAPLLCDVLSCPTVAELVNLDTLSQLLQTWYANGQPLGFSRISAGFRQIVEHTEFRNQTGEAARTLVSSYLLTARDVLTSSKPTAAMIGQDGSSCRYQFDAPTAVAEVQLRDGLLSQLAIHYQNQPAAPEPTSASSQPASATASASAPAPGPSGTATNPATPGAVTASAATPATKTTAQATAST